MKAIVLITDSEAMKAFERAFVASGDRGFTIIPAVVGRGKTGLKAGDRVHPGGSSLLFTVLPENELETTLAFLRTIRDEVGVPEQTKLYVMPMDDVTLG
jgi:nitrogen regulatory protein P-II